MSAVEPERCLILDVRTSSLEVDKSCRVSVLASRLVSTGLLSPVLYASREVQFSARKPIVTPVMLKRRDNLH